MTRRDEIQALLALVAFTDPMPYKFHVVSLGRRADEEEILGIQASYMEADTYRPDAMTEQRTRVWEIAPQATDSQIIQTAFKMCLTSAEHRCREGFKYKGYRVFGPHFDIEDIVKLCAVKDGKGQWGGAPGKDFVWR